MAIERDRLPALHLEIDFQMVLQVGADARPVGHDLDALLPQMLGRADAGEHEQLRRVDRGGGEDHFGPGPHATHRAAGLVLDPNRAPVLHHHAADVGMGPERQVAALQRGLEIGVGG